MKNMMYRQCVKNAIANSKNQKQKKMANLNNMSNSRSRLCFEARERLVKTPVNLKCA